MAELANPYRWDCLLFNHPHFQHPDFDAVVKRLQRGEVVAILGGHGMGKSVFLSCLEAHFTNHHSDIYTVLRFDAYASDRSYIQMFASMLGLSGPSEPLLDNILDQWAQEHPERRLILLFDELDRFADPGLDPSESRQFMTSLETWRQKNAPRLGIIGAGGLWLLHEGRSSLGSPWKLRSWRVEVAPFNLDTIKTLAEPFHARTPIPDEVLVTLKTLSGGHPALTIFGLQQLWEQDGPFTSKHIEEIYLEFQDRHDAFLEGIQDGLTLKGKSTTPHRLYNLIANNLGPFSFEQLTACTHNEEASGLGWKQSLGLLIAAGLVQRTSPKNALPVFCNAIPSIIALFLEEHTSPRTPPANLQQRLVQDLNTICHNIHIWGPDFYCGSGRERTLVEEGTFSAFLGVALKSRGWRGDREAVQRSGRTDLKLWFDDPDEHVVVEVKIWGRNDHKQVHHQALDYATDETRAMATVMITQLQDRRAQTYLDACLPEPDFSTTDIASGEGVCCWEAHLRTDPRNVTHFLVPVLRR